MQTSLIVFAKMAIGQSLLHSTVIIALLHAPFVLAQTNHAERLNLRHFNVEDGLSQGSINAILQDHKGFIWIGTHDGLNRFDGIEFKVFRNVPEDQRSLGSSWIVSLYEDRSQVLWVKTQKGLDRLDRTTESFIHVSNAMGTIPILSTRDTATEFWVGGKPLSLFNPYSGGFRNLRIHFKNGSMLTGECDVFAEDDKGNIWARSLSMVFRIDPERRIVKESYDLNTKVVVAILPSRHQAGVAWIGTSTDLFRVRSGKKVSMGKLSVTRLTEDSRGSLWAGTQDGLTRFDFHDSANVEVTLYRHDPALSTSLPHNTITAICEDASGSLWIGTYNGLSLFDRVSPSFSVYRSSQDNPRSLSDNFVMPIVEDKTGNVWFGTFSAGVSVLQSDGPKAGTFVHFNHDTLIPTSLRSNNVRSMLCGKDGRIWIGSARGLNVYDPKSGKMSIIFSSSDDDTLIYWIESMCESGDGSVWIPFRERLMHIGRDGHPIGSIALQPDQDVGNIIEDTDGILWLATIGSGLTKLDPKTGSSTRYKHDPEDSTSLSNNNVWSIFQEPDDTSGALWIGTSRGLNRLNTRTGKFKRYVEQEEFPNSWIYGILQDDTGRLWMSTNHGLVLFDDRLPAGKKFKNYTHADGIAGDEFNRRAFCKLRNGELLFGGPNGVTRFHPGSVHDNPNVPPLVLTGFEILGRKAIFDRDIADITSIDLNHDQNVFSFEFAALNYSNASKNQYAYMMEGIDKDWIHSGAKHSVNYAYVSPGSYIFRVKASNNSGVWNDNEIAVHLRVFPPFWATSWFIALGSCLAAGLVVVVIRARVHRLLEMERLRSRIARDLHDEIGSNLSSIAMASDLLGRHVEFGDMERGKLAEISAVALGTVKDMKDIVWLINPGNDSLNDMLLRMKDTAATLLERCQYSLSFPAAGSDRKVSLEWKRNVYFIYKETLTNIMKHSGATAVNITVGLDGDRLVLRINDNGSGFDQGHKSKGDGLKNVRDRAIMLHARFEVDTHTGRGTSVTLEARIT